jgi:ribosomal protein S18 acetylase RimI-like enzyme
VTVNAPPPGRPVLATYLHLPSPSQFRPSPCAVPGVTVVEATIPHVPFYRFLYDEVGRGYSWVDRLRWSDEQLEAHLRRPEVTVLVIYQDGSPAGYAELVGDAGEQGTELAYFGIFPAFQGRGLGKCLLTAAVDRAFADGAPRVWLSTRTTDGPHAIRNYEARGFTVYKTDWEPAPVHPGANLG